MKKEKKISIGVFFAVIFNSSREIYRRVIVRLAYIEVRCNGVIK